MKHIILGTAGHVDHGKTALVQALTGINCDTHKEEKARGITINLGFANLNLTKEMSVGLIDVPGHRDFIHTMVGGAAGFDLGMLVISADSSVMPQTIEHLQIMNVLGIPAGLIVLNKIDLVDEEMVEMAIEEIRELTEGTFLEMCPIVPVSAKTGAGIDELKCVLVKLAEKVQPRAQENIFRLFPDRVFSVAGHGTIVTGSVLGGKTAVGKDLYLLPSQKTFRVRSLQRHGQDVEQIVGGDRAALNLVGVKPSEFSRGMVLSDRPLKQSQLIDVRLQLFENARPLSLWSQVIIHIFTYEHQARIHLINKTSLSEGEEGLAQIHLETPCIIQPGDHFVIRNSSNEITLGGGEILDPNPLHHRRRKDKTIQCLEELASGNLPLLILQQFTREEFPKSVDEIAEALNLAPADVVQAVEEHLTKDLVVLTTEKGLFFSTHEKIAKLCKQIIQKISKHHDINLLLPYGLTFQELLGNFGISKDSLTAIGFKKLLQRLVQEGDLAEINNTYALSSHSVDIDGGLQEKIDFILNYLKDCQSQVPNLDNLRETGYTEKKITRNQIDKFLSYLVDTNQAYSIEGEFLHAGYVDSSRSALLNALSQKEEGVTVAEFRDLIDGNRKICFLLYGIYDREGIICRAGDKRIITEKGLALCDK